GYQSASELRSDLKRLQRPSVVSPVPLRPRTGSIYLKRLLGALAVLVLLIGVLWLALNRRLHTGAPGATARYIQLTDFNDSAAAPAISPDGKILAFIHPGIFGTSAMPGQIYAKMLPDGEPVQLTNDRLKKHTPAFSPDGSHIVYTLIDRAFTWDSWQVPVLGGNPRLFIPNASGLSWISDHELLFSELKEGVHMGLVTAREDRSALRDVYVPPGNAGMAHRSALSP